MAEFIRRNSLLISTIVLVIASFQLMSSSVRNRELAGFGAQALEVAINPLQTAHHNTFKGLGSYWDHYLWLMDVEQERNELASRVKELEAKNSQLIESENENERLRSLLSVKETRQSEIVAAVVVGRDPTNWLRTVSIDSGSADNVKPRLPVLDGQGVVGMASQVSANSSKVLLLTDTSSAIDSLVQRTRAQGIVEGMGGDMLSMRYLVKGEDVKIWRSYYRLRPRWDISQRR